ncbi:MAG TPA: hypothetical protein VFL85_03185 [Candidatus Saccharimonadales bacterium]|nr:hypothetical protein [Candidatus Saccharimonadales bacterium]
MPYQNQKEKREYLETIPTITIPVRANGETVHALVDGDYDGEYFSQFKYRLTPGGYVARSERDEDGIQHIIYLHREVQWSPKGAWVTHIDGDKLNNRSCNLTYKTPSEICKQREVRKYETANV